MTKKLIENFKTFENQQLILESDYFNPELEEGRFSNLALAAIMGLSGILGGNVTAQDLGQRDLPKNVKEILTKTTEDPAEAHRLQIMGWRLTDTQIDTIWNASPPDTVVTTISIRLAEGSYFESGKFELSPDQKETVEEGLRTVLGEGGVLINVGIESSTDSQGLSAALSNKLEQMGLPGNNEGLSVARSNAIQDYMEDQGVNGDIIETNNLSEKGEGEIDETARYVKVSLVYLVNDQGGGAQPQQTATYTLTKKVIQFDSEGTPRGKGKKHITIKKRKCGNKQDFKNPKAVEQCYFDFSS